MANKNFSLTNDIDNLNEGESYFEDLLKKSSLFIDESKLDFDCIPEELPHREKELILLSQLFLILIIQPNSVSRFVFITGGIGVGKTVSLIRFGQMITGAARKRKIPLEFIHINCRKERTGYKILVKILKYLKGRFPCRGFSFQDLLDELYYELNRQNKHLILILDELNALIKKNDDLIYALTRINDGTINSPKRISIIAISREVSCLNYLDQSTLSMLQSNIIHFERYTKAQIIAILNSRVKIAIKPNVIDDNILNMIANLVYEKGDMRKALDLLWASVKITETKKLKRVLPECVQLSNNRTLPKKLWQEILKEAESQKLILLMSIINALGRINSYTTLKEIQNEYKQLCGKLKISTRSYSQIINYVHELEDYGIINITIKSKNIRGRYAQVRINNIYIELLRNSIENVLKSRGINL